MIARLVASILFAICLASPFVAVAEQTTYTFGVLSQRSPVLAAQYWNPILDYVSRKAGVTLQLSASRTAPECDAAIAKGEYDFIYSNTIFRRSNEGAGYQVILRPQAEAISGQIVTLADSSVKSLEDLQGKEVGFPSLSAFAGFLIPMNHLREKGLTVTPVFGGNQEGIMGQLAAGRVVAAGVNGQVMRTFATRQGVSYRILWESQPFHGLPISAHPRVRSNVREAVQNAFLAMNEDVEGRRVLEASAAIIKQTPPFGFLAANQEDYRNYVELYRNNRVPEVE
jgi:phosphonate transport system substrate-binding protein